MYGTQFDMKPGDQPVKNADDEFHEDRRAPVRTCSTENVHSGRSADESSDESSPERDIFDTGIQTLLADYDAEKTRR